MKPVPTVAGAAIAFAAGMLSLLSPCVLPLVPAYLSFLTGLSTQELASGHQRARVVAPATLFVLGFTVVFVSLGATASALGRVLVEHRALIEKVAGVAVIAFGVLMTGMIKVPWLYGEARVELERARAFGRGAAIVMGAAFAAGWTPCVGPILGSILALAGSAASVATGSLLLLAYSFGLGIPFVAIAVLFGRARPVLLWLNRHASLMNRVAGAVLVLVGALIVSGRFGAVALWFTTFLPSIEVDLPDLVR